jgi:ATP-dependent exoDNAse (exonuclease V) beta subunit
MRSLGYKAYLKDLQFLSLYEIAETIISNFLPDRPPDIFLHHFLDVVLAYTLREGNSPDQFLMWWDENKQKYSVVLPQGIDAVQVMTIHKAKGLEFPIVLLPKASWKIKTGKDGMWISPNLPNAPDLCSAMVRPHKDLLQTDFAELYNEEIEKSFLDNLNLLYVALTRAEQRLYIFCSEVNKTPTGNASVNSLFIHFLESKSLWDLNKKCYEFGEPETPKGKDNKKKRITADYTLQSVSSSSWRNRLRIKLTHRDISQQADWGTIVHAALAKIITLNDIHDAVEELAITGLIERDQSLTLEQSLTGLLHQDDVKRFFEPGLVVKTEAEMILADQTIRRIDRVILADKHAIVIDYKTGHSNNDEYRQQLDLYAEAVQQMGYTFVEKYLLYTDENKLVKI